MEDVYSAIIGKGKFVRLPVPLEGHPPIHSLSFVGGSEEVPHQLSVADVGMPEDVSNVSRRMLSRYASAHNRAPVEQDRYRSTNRDRRISSSRREYYETESESVIGVEECQIEDLVESISDEIENITSRTPPRDRVSISHTPSIVDDIVGNVVVDEQDLPGAQDDMPATGGRRIVRRRAI